MAIRPIDVRRKEFKAGFRGYDANQVDDFLDQVADEFERSYTENQRMREEISGLRERLSQFEDLEGSIRSALVHAEQAANDLRASSQREADDLKASSERDAESLRISSQKEAELTIQEAQTRSHQMLSDSSARVERIQESYEGLQEAKRGFTNDFRQLLKTYMDVMEDMEISSAKDIESSLRNRLDTESIAVAREASERDQPTLDEPLDETSGPGPLYEAPPEETAASSDETMKIDPVEPAEETGEISSQGVEEVSGEDEALAEEPEVEPSMVANGSEVSGESEPGEDTSEQPEVAEEVDQEEPAFDEDEPNETADDFFGDREDRRSDRGEDNRIFRASRFLRRRG